MSCTVSVSLTLHLRHRTARFSPSYPRRRHHRRRLLKHITTSPSTQPPSDQNLHIILTVDHFATEPMNSLRSRLDDFVDSGREALEDLRTLVSVAENPRRVVVSCRRSTVRFVGVIFLSSFVLFCIVRILFKVAGALAGLGGGLNRNMELVYRRDRSLGGREVLVAKRETRNRSEASLLDQRDGETTPIWKWNGKSRKRKAEPKNLPKWWPGSSSGAGSELNLTEEDKEEFRRMANRIIRAIKDNRMSGKDILMDDVIQLRRICKTSGVRVVIDPENERDSLYRSSVNFILKYYESMVTRSGCVQIDGEDARQFIAGLADNISLEDTRAARMVSAAVAARTRSLFLQAWAFEMQGRNSEAVSELSKICLIHRMFPPEDSSPEMEMVAEGLSKHLKLDQREFLMNTIIRVCGDDIQTSMAEALGLTCQ